MKHLLFFLSFCGLIFTSCGRHKHDHGHNDPGHSHEEEADAHEGHSSDEKLQLIAYSDNYEVFAEADPFSIEKSSSVLVHLTDLNSFKPIETDQITLSLIVGEKEVRQTPEGESHPVGIYKFQLQPQLAGTGKLILNFNTQNGISQVNMDGIQVFKNLHEAYHAVGPEKSAGPGMLVFTKEQSWKMDFATAHPELKPLGQVIKTSARIVSDQSDEVIVSARTQGIVVFAGNPVVEGRSVSSGSSLFSISGAGMMDNNIQVRFAEAQATYAQADANYQRAQELAKDKIVSEKDLSQLRSNYETAKAVYTNLSDNFTAKGQTVSSPITGYVKQLFVGNGQHVEAGQSLVSIAQNKNLLIKADVQSRYAASLPLIVSANFRMMNSPTTHTLAELNGKVLSFGKSVNEDNFQIPVTFQVDNKAGFVSGSFVEVFIKTQSTVPVISIPNEALMEEQGVYFIFIQVTPELFEKREVKIGVNDGIRTEIQSGLSVKERVVTKGTISVKLLESSGAPDPHAGHVH